MSSFYNQEYFGWVGNGIFICAQVAQIIHTFGQKRTEEISYILEIMWIIGNAMYTAFGYIDNSESMFYGNLISLILSIIQISQKIYYDRKNRKYLIPIHINNTAIDPLLYKN